MRFSRRSIADKRHTGGPEVTEATSSGRTPTRQASRLAACAGLTTNVRADQVTPLRWEHRAGAVALGEAQARETVDPWAGQIARASWSTAAITRKVTVSATP